MSEKRTQIMKAALKLFCEHGFQNTSTASISKEADVATGTLFLYFPSKESLINTLYIESKKEMSEFLQEGLQRQKTPRSRVRHIWMRANEWALQNQNAFRFTHMFAASPYISTVTRKEAASSADFAEKFIRAAIREGAIGKMSLPLFFSIFDGLWIATVNHCATLKSKKNRQKIAEQAFEVFWKGISK